jgi:hypothetical protein
MKTVQCDICKQNTDIYTKIHKTVPFVDGRNYERVCFGCFNVPRTSEQTYSSDGSLRDHIEFDYSHHYLHSAKELTDEGCCDTLSESKTCVEAVIKLCKNRKKSTKLQGKPKPDWIVL